MKYIYAGEMDDLIDFGFSITSKCAFNRPSDTRCATLHKSYVSTDFTQIDILKDRTIVFRGVNWNELKKPNKWHRSILKLLGDRVQKEREKRK